MAAVIFRVPSRVRFPVTLTLSLDVPSSKFRTDVPPSVSAPVERVPVPPFPGERYAPEAIFTVPLTVPVPPSVAPLFTFTVLPAAVAPVTIRVPFDTVVLPDICLYR